MKPETRNPDAYYPADTNLRYQDIPHERERKLFVAAKAGDVAAREFLIRNHLLFALNQGRRWSAGKLPENEVASAANYALMTAIDRFDPARENRFTSYLRLIIRREMVALWHSKNIVDRPKFSVPGEGNAVPMNFAGDSERSNHRDSETSPEAKGELPTEPTSVDHPVEEEDHRRFVLSLLERSKSCLTDREREVLERHFGEQQETLDSIGKGWNLTRARISKIKLDALAKLRQTLTRELDAAGVTR